MNILFKIKHYLAPYFLLKPSYKFNDKARGFNSNYWIRGYAQNITNKKWDIEDGIPLGLYTKNLKFGLEKRVHIAGLCEYCFANKELSNEEENDKVIDFIYNNISHKHDDNLNFNYSFWKTYTNPEENIYYVHGMGQGQMLSLFSRYWLQTKDSKYLELLITISNSYLVNFGDENGFVNLEGGTFFEEYPKKQDTDPKVFNGWMLAIIGLYDYLEVAVKEKDNFLEEKKKLFNDSIKTLMDNLQNYNLYYWTTYCQPKSILNICSMHYQVQHISFLKTLYHITKEEKFAKYNRKLLIQFYNPIFRILSLVTKLLISNIFKYGRLYKSS